MSAYFLTLLHGEIGLIGSARHMILVRSADRATQSAQTVLPRTCVSGIQCHKKDTVIVGWLLEAVLIEDCANASFAGICMHIQI